MADSLFVFSTFAAGFIFIYRLVKLRHQRTIIRMFIENNLLNNSSTLADFKLSFEDKSKRGEILLPITLGVMGFALGLFISVLMINSNDSNNGDISFNNYFAKDILTVALPLFFASIGLLISYFIQRGENRNREIK